VGGARGPRAPIHATAIGKAIAAALSPERVAALLRDRPLHAITSRTITSRAQFDVELEVTRERGFAIDVGECQDDANCVAAAVFDGTGVIAGISVSATAGQMPAADLPLVGAAVAETARKLSANLGQRPDRGQSGSTSRLSSQSQWSTS
jgi:IclR family acetate operon transcriptional repressor